VEGYGELKTICRKFKRDNDLEYKPSQIRTGAKQSLYNIAQSNAK
jgi:aspartate aminotransferase